MARVGMAVLRRAMPAFLLYNLYLRPTSRCLPCIAGGLRMSGLVQKAALRYPVRFPCVTRREGTSIAELHFAMKSIRVASRQTYQ